MELLFDELRQANQNLQQEIMLRQQAEESLCQVKKDLELRVAERTDELVEANRRLQQEIEQRKQVEAALQKRESQLQALFDHTLDAIAIVDDEGRYVEVNPAACDLFGLSREELLRSQIADFAEPGFDVAQAWQHFKQQGQMQGEFSVYRPDGEIRETEFSAVANFIPHRHLSILRDISERQAALRERKQAEISLRESEQKLQAIINNCAVAIYMIDPQNRHLLVNRLYAELLSTTPENLKGKSIYEFWPADTADRFAANNQQVLTSNQLIQLEEVVPQADGVHTYITVKFPVCNALGQPYAVGGISTDITKYKQAQQQILKQAALIDIASDAIFVCDLENGILFWNKGAERLYGWTVEESLGKKAHELFYKESLSQLEAGLKATIEHGSWQGELEQITKTGRKIIVASRWTLVCDESGKPQSILVVNTDITEKKQLEQQFYRAQRLESMGTLASGIAHDLNNVFAPIIMIAQLLPSKCKNVDARTQELFKTLETSSKRGSDLVKQILTFARGTEGKRILLQPGHLLKELTKVIKQTFPKSIEIVTDIPTNTLWMVKADPTQLDQVFMNLAVNARDAMPNGGKLTITAENSIIDETYARMHLETKVGCYVVVTVTDTGTGIPPELLERIFDPFFTTKEVGKGTGLGLSTVLGIVKNHDGFVKVSSQVGQGTKFQVFLPRGEGTAIESTIEAELPTGNGELILVVDDEAVVQQTIQETLADYNYKTLVANDGIEAIALYVEHQSKISTVLLDMLMPNMDGLTTIRTLRKLNPNVKIIANSGLPASEQKAIAAGADKFLSKPYTATDLLTTLSDVINK
ncbi:PAS domain S-box protein [Nostoc sp. FACHB-152]|uniref:hybrid sensor histidine kinase/response regulator n=1 Tax=unclassified Nostoc TaxID=2593658 RepID=UPI0016844BB5|nr:MULTISPECIES: PAS domain-containing sensor histidine kinase [unclassified Nostoc]MBD2445663.1 PAS domain S-box protein [Nostoc sp. FACHB-152]MBD2466777.1 PAS domain S-box protein [Nostoc sp. FACHB-145]